MDVDDQLHEIDAKNVAPVARTSEKLMDNNWPRWRDITIGIFQFARILPIVDGTLPCPDIATCPNDHATWQHNDAFAKCFIREYTDKS